jgi:hypothetical protein
MAIDGRTDVPRRFERANLFELTARRVRVSFSTTSFAGGPQLQYQDRRTRRLFRGDEIRIEDTALGSLITVTLESIPDLRTVTFTLVLPPVNVVPGSIGSRLRVPGITTTAQTTIAGPGLGPEKTYQTLDFEGTAQFVMF